MAEDTSDLQKLIDFPPFCPDCSVPMCASHTASGQPCWHCHECHVDWEHLSRAIFQVNK